MWRRCVPVAWVVFLAPLFAAQETPKLPRVLILGDSISLGYTVPVRKLLAGKAEVLRPAENCQHTAHGLAKIKTWLGDGKWDVIHFNWGIWDTHLLDAQGALIRPEPKSTEGTRVRHTPEQYRDQLGRLVDALEKTGAKLIWASTTPILSRKGERFEAIKNYNAIAQEIMSKRGIATNDLYEFVLPQARAWQSADQVHFSPTGNEHLAKQVSASILKALMK